jgi:hypothetical protein
MAVGPSLPRDPRVGVPAQRGLPPAIIRAKAGTEIWIDIRGKRTPATVGSRTFYTNGTAKKDVT